jgi:hypothetical protein
MPVVEAVQTFVGIDNENEFYSHHYLAEVFKGDIKERLEQWAAAEEADPTQRAPYKRLAGLSGQWFAWRNAGNRVADAFEQLASFQEVQRGRAGPARRHGSAAVGTGRHPPHRPLCERTTLDTALRPRQPRGRLPHRLGVF